jgi:selenocysteine-specific elongation factor
MDVLARQPEISAPEFKEIAGGVSRKWAIPLLEYFDRCRVTLRVGDNRRLHPSRVQN